MLPFPFDNVVMIAVGSVLIYLAIKKNYEPLLLLPIGFGAILVNIPYTGLMDPGGFFRIIYDFGIITDLFPILLFIGIGAMCDFGPILERPLVLLLAVPAVGMGIFIALLIALLAGFTPLEAVTIGMIGAMDGPTTIYVSTKYAPQLIAAVTAAAYSYMAFAPILQAPISKALTTRKERRIRMEYTPRAYSKSLKMIFPIIVTLVTGVIAPKGIPLMGSLMLGNFMKESGVVDKLLKASQNEIANVTTLLLGLTIGGTMIAGEFLTVTTLLVFVIGIVAFVSAFGFGITTAKIASRLSGGKINPLIGATAVSAFPMAARTAHRIGRQEDQDNWLLPHAMAANIGGQIASVIAAGIILTLVPLLL